jgi:hypothetical protein
VFAFGFRRKGLVFVTAGLNDMKDMRLLACPAE